MNGELPEGWATSTVGELSEPLVSGFASGQKDVAGGLRHLRMNNISQECALDLSLVRKVPPEMRSEKLLLRHGDSVCCTTNSGKLVGKVALFDRDGDWGFSNHLTRVRPRREVVEPMWLYFGLRKLWTENAYEEFIKNWVNQAALPKHALGGSEVRLAPLPEQRRIIEKVEALLEQVNRAKERLGRVTVILKRFRQAVLAAACSGELTREWRATHPDSDAGEAIVRAARERMKSWLAGGRSRRADKYPTPPGAEAEGDAELPPSWRWASGRQMFLWGSGAFLPKTKMRAGKVPVYGGNGISGQHDEALVRCRTLVVGRVGALCGNVHVTVGPAWITDNAIYATWAASTLNLNYARMVLLTRNLNANAGGSGQPFVSQHMLDSQPLPFPPPAEQAEIVREVDRLFGYADAIERRVQVATMRAERLPQAILSKAFSGELVPTEAELARAEGRTYETAEELLARVRREAADTASAPNVRRRVAGARGRA